MTCPRVRCRDRVFCSFYTNARCPMVALPWGSFPSHLLPPCAALERQAPRERAGGGRLSFVASRFCSFGESVSTPRTVEVFFSIWLTRVALKPAWPSEIQHLLFAFNKSFCFTGSFQPNRAIRDKVKRGTRIQVVWPNAAPSTCAPTQSRVFSCWSA